MTKKPTDERISHGAMRLIHEPTDEPTLEPIAKPIDNWAIVSITLSIADSIDEPIHLPMVRASAAAILAATRSVSGNGVRSGRIWRLIGVARLRELGFGEWFAASTGSERRGSASAAATRQAPAAKTSGIA